MNKIESICKLEFCFLSWIKVDPKLALKSPKILPPSSDVSTKFEANPIRNSNPQFEQLIIKP